MLLTAFYQYGLLLKKKKKSNITDELGRSLEEGE